MAVKKLRFGAKRGKHGPLEVLPVVASGRSRVADLRDRDTVCKRLVPATARANKPKHWLEKVRKRKSYPIIDISLDLLFLCVRRCYSYMYQYFLILIGLSVKCYLHMDYYVG